MAILVGNAGKLNLGTNTVAEMNAWTLDVKTNLEETQAFGDTWKESTATIREWSGTGAGNLDITDTNGHVALSTATLGGTTVTPRFYVSSTSYYSGTAYVTASFSAAENGLITVSYSFTGTGALTLT